MHAYMHTYIHAYIHIYIYTGKVIEIDEEGDAEISFEGIDGNLWVFKQNLANISVFSQEESVEEDAMSENSTNPRGGDEDGGGWGAGRGGEGPAGRGGRQRQKAWDWKSSPATEGGGGRGWGEGRVSGDDPAVKKAEEEV
jgi:hypothetical protein